MYRSVDWQTMFYEAERQRIKLDGGNKTISLIVIVYNVELQSAFQVVF